MSRIGLAAVLIGAASLSPAARVADPRVSEAGIEDVLPAFRAEYGFPGATVAIALPDGEVVTTAIGLADIEAGTPMTSDSRMLAASIGKTFVGATMLSLESEGLLDRDDLLSEHLADRTWFADLPGGDAIMLGHLLRHQSGLPDHPHLPASQEAAAVRFSTGQMAFTPEEILGFVAGEGLLFAPGSAWAYSDTGYILLGLVIEAVTGRDYYDIVGERFLQPLGLDDTVPSDRRDIPGLAVGYTVPDNPFGLPLRTADAEGRLVWDPAVEWTGGGYASTARDLVAWGHHLYIGAAMEGAYLVRLLDAVPVSLDAPAIRYGAGVAIYADTPYGPVHGHGGWISAYGSSLRHYADYGVTIAFQINTDDGIAGDDGDLVPNLEAGLAELAFGPAEQARQ